MNKKLNDAFSEVFDSLIGKVKSITIFFNLAKFLKVFSFGLLMFFWGCAPSADGPDKPDDRNNPDKEVECTPHQSPKIDMTEGEDEVYISEVSGHGGGLFAIEKHQVWFEVYFNGAEEAYERFEQIEEENVLQIKRFLDGYKIKSYGINASTGEISDEKLTFEINGMYIGKGNFYVFYSTLDGTLPGRIEDVSPDCLELILTVVEDNIAEYTFIPIQPVNVNESKYLPYFNKNKGHLELISPSRRSLDVVAWGVGEGDDVINDFFPSNYPVDSKKSIIRKLDSQTKMFANVGMDLWEVSEAISPSLPNDVICVVVDSEKPWFYSFLDEDVDGLPDCSEMAGSTYFGLDLYSAGVRKGTMDMIAEVDYMESDLGNIFLPPTVNSLKSAAAPYEEMGMKIHFDVGELLGNDYNLFPNEPESLKEKSGGNKIPGAASTTFASIADPDGFKAIKKKHFDYRKKNIVHYILKVMRGGGLATGAAGIAEIYGNDSMIAIYASITQSDLDNFTASEKQAYLNFADNLVGLTMAHELGHNIGFGHSGGFGLALGSANLNLNNYDFPQLEKNYEINYPSLMNYLYSVNGIREKENDETVREYFKDAIAPHYYNYIFANKTFEKESSIRTTKIIGGERTTIRARAGSHKIFDLPSIYRNRIDWGFHQPNILLEREGALPDMIPLEELKEVYLGLVGESFPTCLEEMYTEGYNKALTKDSFFIARFLNNLGSVVQYSFDSSLLDDLENNNVRFSSGELVGDDYKIDLDAANEKKVNIDFNCDGDFNDEQVDVIELTKYDEKIFSPSGVKKVVDHSDHDDELVFSHGWVYDKDTLYSARPLDSVFLSVNSKREIYADEQVSESQRLKIFQNVYIDKMPVTMKKLKEVQASIHNIKK